MNSTAPFEFANLNFDLPVTMATAPASVATATMTNNQLPVSAITTRLPTVARKPMSDMIEERNRESRKIRRRAGESRTNKGSDATGKKKKIDKSRPVNISGNKASGSSSGGGVGGRKNDDNRLVFIASKQSRSFHEFVQLVTLYERLTKDERAQLHDTLYAHLSPIERKFCTGDIQKRHSRDIFRALCYGLNVNTNRCRDRAIEHFRKMGIHGIGVEHMTDLTMMKHVDLWYDFVAPNSLCDLSHVSIETIETMLRTNMPLIGRLCRTCTLALVRLARYGLCSELGRCEDPQYAPDQVAPYVPQSQIFMTEPQMGIVQAASSQPMIKRPSKRQNIDSAFSNTSEKKKKRIVSTISAAAPTAVASPMMNDKTTAVAMTAIADTVVNTVATAATIPATTTHTATTVFPATTTYNVTTIPLPPLPPPQLLQPPPPPLSPSLSPSQTKIVAKRQTTSTKGWFKKNILMSESDSETASDDDEVSFIDESRKRSLISANQLPGLNGKN